MDVEKLAALESHITHLLRAFAQVKEENRHLAQRLAQLQQTVYEQQRDLERWQSAQEELLWLRTAVQALQREREVIRARLAAMLVTIERLEQLSQMPTPAAPAEGS